jgi:hypothetical protein
VGEADEAAGKIIPTKSTFGKHKTDSHLKEDAKVAAALVVVLAAPAAKYMMALGVRIARRPRTYERISIGQTQQAITTLRMRALAGELMRFEP